MPSAFRNHVAPSRLPEERLIRSAAVSALVYVVLATVYILVSGRIATRLAGSVEQLQAIEAAKGLVFVGVTGVLFFLLSLGWWRNARRQRNLLIQGDNLEGLKALLPYYAGRVKCIYIDPPYNTSNVNNPEIRRWLGEVVGKEGATRK